MVKKRKRHNEMNVSSINMYFICHVISFFLKRIKFWTPKKMEITHNTIIKIRRTTNSPYKKSRYLFSKLGTISIKLEQSFEENAFFKTLYYLMFIWRDFFLFLSEKNPRISNGNAFPKGDGMFKAMLNRVDGSLTEETSYLAKVVKYFIALTPLIVLTVDPTKSFKFVP